MRQLFKDSVTAIVFFLVLFAVFTGVSRSGLVPSYDTFESGLLSQTKKSVVMLAAYSLEGVGGGTGFFVKGKSGKAYLMTNAHICDVAAHQTMYIADDHKKPGDVIEVVNNELRSTNKVDLCIAQTKYEAPALELASSLSEDEKVYVVGHGSLLPRTLIAGFIGPDEEDTMYYSTSTGDVKTKDYVRFMYTLEKAEERGYTPFVIRMTFVSANVVGGNSGSPVVNSDGKLVGVVFGKSGNGQSGYMVPFKELKQVLEKL